jgi:ABC-type glycerol-3-phosphate transport system substrate-binding protein
MFKKILCMLLAGLMLVGTVGCATSDADGNATGDGQTGAVTERDDELPPPELPDKDYGGQEFRILAQDNVYHYIAAEKSDGTLVNDSVVESNMAVMEQFNVKLERINGTPQTYIQAGDDAYDVAYLHDLTTATTAMRGWFLDIYDMPHMDPTAAWWPQFTVDSLTVNGKMFFYSNYTGYMSMAQTRACLFNQDILDDYNVESPYDLVRAGTWTLDKAIEMSTSIYSDKNGNGVADEGDLFGFSSSHYPWGWLEAFGIELYQKESPNSAVINVVADDRCYTLIEKLHEWFYSGHSGINVELNGGGEPSVSMFAAGQVAFTFSLNLDGVVKPALQNNIPYGIVPFPKIDVNQENYYGACTDFLFSVPVTVRDTEKVGMVLESMAYNGYKYIRAAYCEETLQSRYATDPDCAEMLDLILNNRVISFAYLFSDAVGGGMQSNLIEKTVGSLNISSFLRSRTKAEQKFMKKIAAIYEDKAE